jgi:hypothetical protein
VRNGNLQTLIRERYYDFLTGRVTPEDFKFVQGTSGQNGSNELPHLADLHKGAAHIDHCFDYIQQGIHCAGQMDLEYPVGTEEAGFLAVSWQVNNSHFPSTTMSRVTNTSHG